MRTTTSLVPTREHRSGGTFLTFFLAGEEYGIEILTVQEILGMQRVTAVPHTPVFIRGVTNVRGKVLPVIDLRRKLGMEASMPTAETCIIVVRTHTHETGIIVDKVAKVLPIATDAIEEAPAAGTAVPTAYLHGIAKTDGRMQQLLNIDQVLSTQDIVTLPTRRPLSSGDQE